MKESITRILTTILHTIGVSNKRDKDFWINFFAVLLHMRGRKNYTNISRYGSFGESTLRRRLGQLFDWPAFHKALLSHVVSPDSPVIGVLDCSFIHKSGSKTYGLDKFWSSVAGKSLKGLEVSVLGAVEVLSRRAWALDVQQTPSGVNRLDTYMTQLSRMLSHLPQIKYWVADSFYAKVKVFNLMNSQGYFLISQLRNDANLRYIEPSTQRRKPGRKPKWGEKVDFSELSLWQYLKRDFIAPHLHLYTQELYSPQFKCRLRVVLVKNIKSGAYQIIASSNPKQDPRQVIAYYQLRFQIEFLFRDAKQFAGLEHAQTRKQQNLNNHFNISFAQVNLMNALQLHLPKITSKNSLIRVAFNTTLIHSLIHKLGLEPEFVNSKCKIDYFYNYGAFAA